MAVITPIVDSIADATIFRWMGMMGAATLEDCDVGEAIDVHTFVERSIQIGGPFNTGNRFSLDFNSDPDTMPWFSIIPSSSMLLITPGRSYGAPTSSIWPQSRFIRPRISGTYNFAGPPVDVLLFCINRVT